MVILNSYKSAKEILDKQYANSRWAMFVFLIMLVIYPTLDRNPLCSPSCELSSLFTIHFHHLRRYSSGFGTQFGMMPYGEPWRVRRRLFKKYYNISNAHIYQTPETKYIHRLLVSLAQRPADFVAHIHQYVFLY